ncbi:MAG: glycosyltransferase family 4 protein [Vicinamibacterales bacterium]|nr:glycosyltransferase family 4 protein [Vicinamibacterales bacterium]
MRVAVLTWSSRRIGGVEDYVSSVLPALHRAGHDVALLHEIDEPADRVAIDVPPGASIFCVASLGDDATLDALRGWTPDVLYNQGLSDPSFGERVTSVAPSVFFLHSYVGTCVSGGKTFKRPMPVACNRRFGWPCLLHYFPHNCGGRSPITMWSEFTRQSAQQGVLRHQAAIVTHTEHMRNEMARHGLHAEVVPFPIETSAPADMPFSGECWRLLFAGRMDFLKGGLVFLDALPHVAAVAKRPIHVTLAGDGPDRQQWEARAQELRGGWPNLTIEFTGWVTQQQMGTIMNAVDLLVVPSVWPEPFGTVGPTAGQHGLPSAAFAVGGIRQWLVDGVSGHLAPADPPSAAGLADAIVRCLEDPLHYTALRLGARQMSSNFTMARHLPALLAVLERAAAGERRVV